MITPIAGIKNCREDKRSDRTKSEKWSTREAYNRAGDTQVDQVNTVKIEFARNAGPYSRRPFEHGRIRIWHRDRGKWW